MKKVSFWIDEELYEKAKLASKASPDMDFSKYVRLSLREKLNRDYKKQHATKRSKVVAK